MNYLDHLAQQIKAAVAPSQLPEENTRALFRSYAVLLLAKGADVARSDVHNAWAAWMTGLDPTHPSLVPFSELDEEVAAGDEPFAEAIRSVAREHAK